LSPGGLACGIGGGGGGWGGGGGGGGGGGDGVVVDFVGWDYFY